jgi:hypothetical protein
MIYILCLAIFWGGLFVGYFAHYWVASMQAVSGTMHVIKDEEKTVYSLELNEDPEELAYKPMVIFKVVTDLKKDSHRE